VKCINGDRATSELKALTDAIGDARITVMDRSLSREEMLGLMGACDCYVSLHRAEGFGLTLAESMRSGKPVIATGWSGNMDFMTRDNSYPVAYCLAQLPDSYGPHEQGSTWAEPDLNDAARLMREVFQNREGAEAKGRVACADIIRDYSLESAKIAITDRLSKINGEREVKISVPEFTKDLATLEFHYRIDRYWSGTNQSSLLKKFGLDRILRRLLRPMFDQLADYHKANFRVVNHLLAEVERLKKEVAIRDLRLSELTKQADTNEHLEAPGAEKSR
jgi:hypothetical protein